VSVESAATARLGVAIRLLGQLDHAGGLGRRSTRCLSSIGLFDTSTQADESTRVASEWVRDKKLERILKNPPPKVTDGEVIVLKTYGAVRA
jgi:hypothetical protein